MEQTVYYFIDGEFVFWTAYYDSWTNSARVVFRVRTDTTPEIRAREKNILGYDNLLPSFPNECMKWMEEHPEYPPAWSRTSPVNK